MASSNGGGHYVRTLLLGLAVVGMCPCSGEDEADDTAKLVAMRSEIEELVGVPRCQSKGECSHVAFGSKPCGGPWEYLVYSGSTVDEGELRAKVEAYNGFEDAMNHRWGRMSDCSIASEPKIGCREGVCVDLGR